MEDALKTVVALRDAGVSVSLTIVGVVANESYQASLHEFVRANALESAVTFAGACTHAELAAQYQAADILLNPSATDSIDKVVLEAMVAGVIPVTSTAAFRDMLDPHDLFVGRGDIAAYVAAIMRLRDLSEEARTALSDTLRSVVMREHALETITDRIFNT